MSHSTERKEKICLNCGAFIYGRYCHKCGQENIEPKETFWHLVSHFLNDITHFESKFFSTAKYLLFKPGFLSKEYMKGRRMSYLNPIRMYVFTSAIFFIFFFTFVKPEETVKVNENKDAPPTFVTLKKSLEDKKHAIEETLQSEGLPLATKSVLTYKLAAINNDIQSLQRDSAAYKLSHVTNNPLELSGKYSSVSQYDSAQSKLPASQRDNWINRSLKHRKIALNEKYKSNKNAFINDFVSHFVHSFPQLFFVSLPVIALLLRLLYVRRKNLYYVDHVIYLIHVYCAMFILLFVRISFAKLDVYKYLHWLKYPGYLLVLYMLFYLYKSMRNYYAQRRAKTVFKFVLLLFMSSLIMSVLLIVYGFVSLFTV